MARLAALLAACLLAGPAAAQDLDLVRTCLPGDDQGNAIDLRVDARGVMHLSRVSRVNGGDLLYTRIDADGTVTTEQIAARISRLGIDETDDTGILADGGELFACYRDARVDQFFVARREAAGWVATRLDAGARVGAACDLVRFGGEVYVAWSAADGLRVGRLSAGAWTQRVADVKGGAQPRFFTDVEGGALGVAHRDPDAATLRLARLSGAAWSALEVGPGGWSAAPAVATPGRVFVYHGVRPDLPDQGSDGALWEAEGPITGPVAQGEVPGFFQGGRIDAVASGGWRSVFTRQLQRSALFGDFDALYLFRAQGADQIVRTTLEQSPGGGRRHRYLFLAADHDPFDLPVLAYLDDQSAFFGQPAAAPVCYYRPRDTDADALPDTVEASLGTDPDDADTDGDGRSDGEEVFGGTDPRVPDVACQPVAETCNGEDDDCDGQIDEALLRACYGGPAPTAGVGRCVRGRQTCAAGDWGVCVGAITPRVERCDGVDDDCDGATDEGDPQGGAACATGGLGRCGEGLQRCVGGALVCEPAFAARPEQCDGADDDCDGATDEGTLSCGQGACARTVPACAGGGPNVCTPRVGAPDDPTCDGVDDDCDGRADEDFDGPQTRCGIGACAAVGAEVCVGGAVRDTCAAGGPAPGDATCDGRDDDCDGRADEDHQPGVLTCGVGACRRQGVGECVDGIPMGQCTPGAPAATDATCDGVDDDCDGTPDEDVAPEVLPCGVGACAALGLRLCVGGDRVDQCDPGVPAPDDATCDGVDDDCDGAPDEDVPAAPTACGQGACAATGDRVCRAGAVVDTCSPLAPTGDDGNCDGVDDDCDGAIDEGFPVSATTCGVGACAAQGQRRCIGGAVRDSCRPAAAAAADATCDGRDDDCDGAADEDAAPVAIACGIGACRAGGERLCVDGVRVDDCQPGPPGDEGARCDGVDDDCDGTIDEAFAPQPTTCGVGVCASNGEQRCLDGAVADSCRPGPAARIDRACDGRDDDCDGAADEDFRPAPTTCGVGACRAQGATRCAAGAIEDDCRPGPPGPDDAQCDGVDADCDGATDEDAPATPSACGRGACAAVGQRRCVGGATIDTCTPGLPAPDDRACDGVDADCDGAADEDFVPGVSRCGLGVCAAVGQRACVAGALTDTCRPGAPAGADDDCDGLDDDCDGRTDEGFVGQPTACGSGACAAVGTTRCLDGRVDDTCRPGPPAADDAACDGVDTDCDGATDEDYAPGLTRCGVGGCAAVGLARCVDGVAVDDCRPGRPAPTDADCDGRDDDCDGRTDEGFVPSPTDCGVGACAARGQVVCVAGAVRDTCVPGAPAAADATCDLTDDDCDGAVDEDAGPLATRCGVGACAAEGEARCVEGARLDDCAPAPPRGADDTCDGVDDDCDGLADEAWRARGVRCGVGACEADGITRCAAGVEQIVCTPGRPAAGDATCDGVDDDCDGAADEDATGQPITCGVGACAADGLRLCEGGRFVDRCAPAAPALDDATCDGVDDDCDGATDEDHQATATACGVGACRAAGLLRCVGGRPQDDCRAGPATGADDDCDGVDDDCDGAADEAYAPPATTCGVGVCGAAGRAECRAGRVVDTCRPTAGAAADATCDGLDDDCDGVADEDHQPRPVRCGVGACTVDGVARCRDGVEVTLCTPRPPAADDATCDGRDDDCDGAADEAYVPGPIVCGAGACEARGRRTCEAGRFVDRCTPGQPVGLDATCDGVDDDCDGATDEAVAPRPLACGVGACAAEGERRCVDGAFVDACTPGRPAPGDATCDGLDDDCDGATDEGAAPQRVTCGEGACRRDGEARCVDGAPVTTCAPGAPAADDATCDGRDDDCDGAADEDATPRPVRCGVGACAAAGEVRCVGGAEVQRCAPGAPADADPRCDGLDEDCDGRIDEDWAPTDVLCGVGACAALGRTACIDGAQVERCAPGEPAAADPTCDGVDDDCDGLTDEDFAPRSTACGAGACARRTPVRCVDGVEADVCVAGDPTGADDDCDGVDDDCDGLADEGFAPRPITCGVGACRARGAARCRGGVEVEACAPQAPWPDDVTCDGVDDDCDGRTDEDCAGGAADSGGQVDAGVRPDAAAVRRDACVDSLCGAPPLDVEDRQRDEGCDCRAGDGGSPELAAVLLALVVGWGRRRRARRRG